MKKLVIITLLMCAVSVYAQKSEVEILRDSIRQLKIELSTKKMSVNEFEASFKLARIERYVRICEKRPTNKKYFFGWVRRTINTY